MNRYEYVKTILYISVSGCAWNMRPAHVGISTFPPVTIGDFHFATRHYWGFHFSARLTEKGYFSTLQLRSKTKPSNLTKNIFFFINLLDFSETKKLFIL